MLTWILFTIIVVLLGVIGVGVWFINRGINRMNQTDNILDDLSYNLSIIYTMCQDIRSKEIYSNEPMIMMFVDQLEKFNQVLRSYDTFFQIVPNTYPKEEFDYDEALKETEDV